MNLTQKVQILSDGDGFIEFSLEPHETHFHISLEDLEIGQISVLGNVPEEDQVLIKQEFPEETGIIYIKNQEVLAGLLDRDLNFSNGPTSFAFEIEIYMDEITGMQTSETAVSLFTSEGIYLVTLDDIAAYEAPEYTIPLDLKLATVETRYLLAGKITYGQFNTFLVYDLFRKELVTRNVRFTVLSNKAGLALKLSGPDILDIAYQEDQATVEFRKASGKGRRIFESYQLEDHRDKHMLSAFMINNTRYFIANRQNGVYLTKGNAVEMSGYGSRLKASFSGRNLYLYGRSTHYAYKANGHYDQLYIDSSSAPVAAFRRPLNTHFLRRFGYFKVPVSALVAEHEEPRGLYLGDDELVLHALKLNWNAKREKIVTLKKEGGRVFLLRVAKRGNLSVETSQHPEEYTLEKRLNRRVEELKDSRRMLQLYKLLFLLIGRLPKERRLVIFESFHAKQFSDSPRAIYEYMKEHHPDYRLLWSIDKNAESLFIEFGLPYIRRFTLPWFLHFPRAEYWVNNVRLPAWMPKPRGTKYIQTWHGTPLKRLGTDIEEIHMPGTTTSAYKRNFVTEARKWDLLVSPNPYSTEIFRRAFRYRGEVIESGYPRNDVLSGSAERLAGNLKKHLGIPDDKKVMLYAPTWRDNDFYEKGKYRFEFQFNLDRWKEEFGDEWVLLSRMHYLVAESFDFSACEGTVYDVSSYPDIRDLYLVSDLMITDYSSVFFDFAVLNRPIVFFMYDLEQYRDQLRGFYIDIEKDAPGPIAETEDELFVAIKRLKDAEIQRDPNFMAFKEKFSAWEDGHATERVVEAFLSE